MKTEKKYGWTSSGPCLILAEEGAMVTILLPGRKVAKKVSASHLTEAPTTMRLVKAAEFDQKCGCTAVVDVKANTISTYNIYGSLKKYANSDVVEGSEASAHHRREFLKENGFSRARGQDRKVAASEVLPAVFGYVKKGYKLVA